MNNEIPAAKPGKKAKEKSVAKDNNCKEAAAAQAKETEIITDPLALAEAKCAEYKDIAQRVKAEYVNYRKRTQEEMKQIFWDGASCVLNDLLDIGDNFERALTAMADGADKEGVVLIKKQLDATLQKYEVAEIPALGEAFNPELHNAVLQVEDEEKPNQVVEVFKKGYVRQGKVLRYSMVKVAK